MPRPHTANNDGDYKTCSLFLMFARNDTVHSSKAGPPDNPNRPRKFIAKTTQTSTNLSISAVELVTDVIISTVTTKNNNDWTHPTGSTANAAHLRNGRYNSGHMGGSQPVGANILFQDSHAEFRSLKQIPEPVVLGGDGCSGFDQTILKRKSFCPCLFGGVLFERETSAGSVGVTGVGRAVVKKCNRMNLNITRLNGLALGIFLAASGVARAALLAYASHSPMPLARRSSGPALASVSPARGRPIAVAVWRRTLVMV